MVEKNKTLLQNSLQHLLLGKSYWTDFEFDFFVPSVLFNAPVWEQYK